MSVATKTNKPKPGVKLGVRFGEWLVSKNVMSTEKLNEALREQRTSGGRLGEVLLRLEILTHKDITNALAEYLGIDCVNFEDTSKINMDVARSIPEAIAKRFCLIAIGEADDKIIVAMGDPLNVVAIDTIALKLKRRIKPVISSIPEIQHATEVVYHGSDLEEQKLKDIVELDAQNSQDDVVIEDIMETDISKEADANDAPVIQFVNLLLSQAVKSKASDIHIEPREKVMSIRMRADGVLRSMVPPPPKMQAAVTTRLKILSEMDIAERRLPQDGRFKIKATGRDVDVRVSTIPTIYGEKIVMRLLDKTAVDHDIEKLGFSADLLKKFKMVLKQPHGIIIVTGPTGSGKSTTLYSSLAYMNDPTKNITTVEDPVEYRLDGINQVQVKPEIKLDFAKCLRAILRQDPDIVLIGEIRDKETMEIAIKASLTGHLVMSTFHTNDAPSAISRLVYMGLEPYLLASTLNMIIAQRLVRKICDKCKEPVELSEEVLKHLHIDPADAKGKVFYHGKGCPVCGGTGYKGRLPIFEFLMFDRDIREKLVAGAGESELREAARAHGYGGLLESGVEKLMAGITTAEEVLNVTFEEDIT
ncbi:MAG: Flp pilus assembly complex ATPase component TadA [Planctomycetes bacterium]|nr:Flp pilus assembly complex ATPase component TadA [Planctomycetota bacterium]